MLTTEEITAIVDRYVEHTKDWAQAQAQKQYGGMIKSLNALFPSSDAVNTNTIPNQLPEYWVGYNYVVQQMQSIEPHTTRALFPERLFNLRTPNQTTEELEYIKQTFKSVTLPVWQDFISTLSRGANRSNYSLRFEGDEAKVKDFEDYLEYYLPIYNSFYNWILQYEIPLAQKDANGYIAVMPYEIPTTTNEAGDIVMSDEMVKPLPYYFSCKNTIGKGEHYYLFLSPNEYSVVLENDKPKRIGQVLYLFDDTYIYRIEQTGKRVDFKFSEQVIYFEHLCGEVPVQQLGGVPNYVNDKVVFDSAFSFVSDILDLVLLDQNNLNIAKTKCIYPYRIMLGSICDFEIDGAKCDNGYILSETGTKNTCPACKGRGSVPRISPLGELLINPEDVFGNGDKLTTAPIQYVSPSTETVEFLKKEIADNEIRARKIVHLNDSDAKVAGNESTTATGSLNKLRSTYAFIKPINSQTFKVAFKVLDYISIQRTGGAVNVYGTEPTSFDINTPSDYLDAINEAKLSGVAPFIMYQLYSAYLMSISKTDPLQASAYDLLLNTDLLLGNTQEEIALRIASGTAEKWMDIVHNSGLVLIYQLHDANERFFKLSMEEQKTQLVDLAKKLVETPPTNMRADVIV